MGFVPDEPPVELVTLELDLASRTPPAAEVEACLERCAAMGVRFFTLAEAGDTPDTRRRLYELVSEGVVDDPGNDGTFMGFEEFSERLFEPFYWRWASCQVLAAKGGEWIGLTNLQLREGRVAEFGVTVVKRAHREQGIARALKLLALRRASDLGVETVRTWNHQANEPMLRLNERLGFVAK